MKDSVDPLWVEFADPQLERDFLRHHLPHTRASLRTTLTFCALFFLAFSLTDLAALGSGRPFWVLLAGRIVVAVTAFGGLYYVSRKVDSVRTQWLAANTAEIVAMTIFMAVVWFRPGELPWHAMSVAIMVIVIYVFIPNRLVYVIGVALTATLAFIVLATIKGGMRFSDDLTMAMLLLLTNSFGIVAARRYHRLWRDEYRALSTLKTLSIRDHLTGCFNRRHLHATLLPDALKAARTNDQWLTLMVCDIDFFKQINDLHGHQSGDAVLSHVAELLQQCVPLDRDSVVRYGGEEFLIVLPQTNLDMATKLAEAMRAGVAESALARPDGRHISTTVSIGVLATDFSIVEADVTESALIVAADTLLYEAKRAGRNTICSGLWSELSYGASASGNALKHLPAEYSAP
ncbi:diguanylate cyclase [Cupriavidus pauculus]|uniref:GGDEF domain-containing protein n=1 Tax=Cupriavidus pauculus TaxID=82633 RepID=UPI001EE2C523|nr:GGDEF domain-containing protein [Cupriavidus pauculus]GJG95436.1 GGDEF domain-containing protein [Cupriavidus pauculus]